METTENQPRFTVLIAVFNGGTLLDECLDSLSRQTEPSFEALCVDDCSTDDTPRRLARRAKADPRFVSLKTEENSGQAKARNLAIDRARGVFTLMLDADDTLAPDALEQLWRAACAHAEADGIVMNLVNHYPDGSTEPVPFPTQSATLSGREACLLSIDLSLHGVCALRTGIFKRRPYYDTLRRYSDDATAPVHYLMCRRVVLAPAATYRYRRHPHSCTAALDARRTDFLLANALLRRELERRDVGPEALSRCERFCWYNFVGLYATLRPHLRTFTPADRAEALTAFKTALRAMRFRRLPRDVWRQPSTWPLRPFALFRLRQRLLDAVKKVFRR